MTFFAPTEESFAPTLGPHLETMTKEPTVGQNKAVHWVHNSILLFQSQH